MEVDLDKVTIVDNAAAAHEARQDGRLLAYVMYERAAGQIAFTHTVVAPMAEGKGVGSKLAQAVLDEARSQDAAVVPLCPFVKAYIERHPEYQAIVRPSAGSPSQSP